MAFDIDKMKVDGVSAHLIELASMEQETFLLLIARRLEHDKLFQQFMGENAGSIEAMYPYAVAAGLMSESDREWLIDEDNPYKSQSGEVWYTGTVGECEGGFANVELLATSEANTTDLLTNYNSYSVSINNIPMVFIDEMQGGIMYSDTGKASGFNIALQILPSIQGVVAKCPTDLTDIEVTVAHE